jgi:LysR family transcriptional regulator, cell division regulator
MDLVDLETFAAVAKHGGVTRAASALNTVQSNVTGRLKRLEAELGACLFERHSRGVALTTAGQRLLPYAERIQAMVAEARQATADDGTPRGPLRLGAMETTAALRLPPLLIAYTRACPEVELVVGTGPTAALVQDVLEHRLDAALVAGPVAHPELKEEAAFEEELVLVTAPGLRGPNALARAGELKVLVFRAGCSYRQRLEAILAAQGISGARRLEFGTLDGIVGCVAARVGVTLLPRAVVEPAWREGRVALHTLPAAEAKVTTVLVRRRDAYVSSALNAFLHAIRGDQSLAAAAA